MQAIKCPRRKKKTNEEKACNASVVKQGILPDEARTFLKPIAGALVFTSTEHSSMRGG
jgi:hypothetical protein